VTSLLTNIELLERLVAFDSVSRNSNLPIADFICDYLDGRGLRVARNPSADGSKANVIVMAGPEHGGADRPGLVLSGHMDVVPADEPEWESDPFVLTRKGETLVGRGACDMKGFLAVAMNRLAATDPASLRHPLALVFTYDEEVGTMGARRFVESGAAESPLPRRTVIGEPTSMRVARMHKGHIKLRFTFPGRSAHSGYPHLGQNAIEPAGRAIVALSELRAALEQERPPLGHHFDPVPFVTLNVAQIAGGVAVNIVPDRCVLDVGFRLLPGMERDPMVARIRYTVEAALGGGDMTFELVNESPPMLLDGEADIFHAACAEAHQEGEHTIAFTTDGGWFSRAGMDCVIFGPGAIEVAHRPNEFVPVAELQAADAALDQLVRRFCR
jgi:acetylornithine deacetylase